MTSFDEQSAWKKVKQKKDFFKHASSFIGVGIGLFFINVTTSPGAWWFYFPLAGWSIGLVIHYLNVFGIPLIGSLDDDWEQKEFEKEIERKERLKPDRLESDYLDLEEVVERRKDWRDSDLV